MFYEESIPGHYSGMQTSKSLHFHNEILDTDYTCWKWAEQKVIFSYYLLFVANVSVPITKAGWGGEGISMDNLENAVLSPNEEQRESNNVLTIPVCPACARQNMSSRCREWGLERERESQEHISPTVKPLVINLHLAPTRAASKKKKSISTL